MSGINSEFNTIHFNPCNEGIVCLMKMNGNDGNECYTRFSQFSLNELLHLKNSFRT